jgi:hypothetical protein
MKKRSANVFSTATCPEKMRRLCLTALFFCCAAALNATTWETLRVRLKSGGEFTVALDQRPVIRFDGDNVLFSANGSSTLTLLFSAVEQFTYDEATAIHDARTTARIYPNPVENYLYITLPAGKSGADGTKTDGKNAVGISNAAGGTEVVPTAKLPDGRWRLDMKALAKGLYIVNINGQSFKIIKR